MRTPTVRVDVDVAPACAPVADRLRLIEVPDTHFEPEIAVGQRANGTDVGQATGVRIIHRRALDRHNLRVRTALENPQLVRVRDFIDESRTTRTQNAALRIEHDVRPDGNRFMLLLFVLEQGGIVAAEVHVELLQLAFPRLVTHRAVERVIREQELQNRLPRHGHLLGGRVHDHSVGDERVAGDQQLRRLLHLDQAHAAGTGDRQPRVVTVAGNENPQLLRRLDDRRPLRDIDALTVYRNNWHNVKPDCSVTPLRRMPDHRCAFRASADRTPAWPLQSTLQIPRGTSSHN